MAPLYTWMFNVLIAILGKALLKEAPFPTIQSHYKVNVNGLVSELENWTR